jgi:sugar-specific transcriptional regulator TrmB
MVNEALLQKLGLTNSEAKVYLALLKIGTFSSKGQILKETRTAPSKIYHVLDKLADKGLVSVIIKNNVKHFAAAPPTKIRDYITSKKQEITEEEKATEDLIPQLNKLYRNFREKTTAEVFLGRQGLETVYSSVLSDLKMNEPVYILGASAGTNTKETTQFFTKYSLRARSKNVQVKIIFNENSRKYVKAMEKETKITFDKRFLFKTTPVEIVIVRDMTGIVILKEEPVVVLIKDKETAESFITYFKELWNVAKKK